MPEIPLSISAQNYDKWRQTAKKLREAGRKDLRSALRKQIAEAGKPVVDEVKEKVRQLEVTSSHGGGTGQRRKHNIGRAVARAKTDLKKAEERARRKGAGLRETIAAATRLQQTAKGIRIITQSDRLPQDQRSLPRHLDSDKGWRHPVFGNRDNWVRQRGGPWFADTIKKKAPEFRQSIVEAMDETVRNIEE